MDWSQAGLLANRKGSFWAVAHTQVVPSLSFSRGCTIDYTQPLLKRRAERRWLSRVVRASSRGEPKQDINIPVEGSDEQQGIWANFVRAAQPALRFIAQKDKYIIPPLLVSSTYATILLRYPHWSLLDEFDTVLQGRPEDVPLDAWLLAVATSQVVGHILVCMAGLVMYYRASEETKSRDRAIAGLLALCTSNNRLLRSTASMVSGLEEHPDLGAAARDLQRHQQQQLRLQTTLLAGVQASAGFQFEADFEQLAMEVQADLALQTGLNPAQVRTAMLDPPELPDAVLAVQVAERERAIGLLMLTLLASRRRLESVLVEVEHGVPGLQTWAASLRSQLQAQQDREDRNVRLFAPNVDPTRQLRAVVESIRSHLVTAGVDPDDLLLRMLGPAGVDSTETAAARAALERLVAGQEQLEVAEGRQSTEEKERLQLIREQLLRLFDGDDALPPTE